MKYIFSAPRLALALGAFAAFSLSGCGSSGGGDGATPVATTTVSGVVYASPVSGAQVRVKDSSGATVGGPVTTGADGSYSVTFPASLLNGALNLESDGGNFTDEATGTATVAGKLSAHLAPSTLTGGKVHLDPSSTIIHDLVGAGKTPAQAVALFEAAFGFTPDCTVKPAAQPGTGIENGNLLAGVRSAAFSQLAKDRGLTPAQQFALISEIGQDLADGTLDGKNGATALALSGEDISGRFANAVSDFLGGPHNLSGLKADQVGNLPFGKVVLTPSYRVEYIPGMMGAVQGKTKFKIKINNRSDDSAATGLTASLKLMPLMRMSTMSHSSPLDDTIIDNGDGTYSCTVYYLMASSMGGMSMGYWDLKVMIGSGMAGESATFHPMVGMAMGSDTVRAVLKGQADMVGGMGGASKRSYYLFKDQLTGTDGNHTFGLFLAAGESMMSFPPLYEGMSLHDAMGGTYAVTDVDLSFSTDGTTWIPAVNTGGGHWSAGGLTGLAAGVPGQVQVRLSVNGEDKTTDGNTPSSATDHAVFNVTP